jgi:hypothetical protein
VFFPFGNSINDSIFQIANKLAGFVRTVKFGTDLPEMIIHFRHRFGPTCLALCLTPTPAGSDVRVEFREFPNTGIFGCVDIKSENTLLHEAIMSPQQVADMLHDTLDKLLQFSLMNFYKADRHTLKYIFEYILIYDTEGKNLEWPQARALKLPHVAAA